MTGKKDKLLDEPEFTVTMPSREARIRLLLAEKSQKVRFTIISGDPEADAFVIGRTSAKTWPSLRSFARKVEKALK